MKGKTLILLAALAALTPSLALAGNEYGGGFLKIGAGARQIGMGRTFAGVGDDLYTMFWNPGGLGFIRRWQWAAGYDQWLADTYQGSLLAAKQFHFLGSRKFTIGAGGLYFGMPKWDSTEGEKEAVSANSIVGVVSVGQRLDWLTWPLPIGRHLSIGASVKVIHSRLADYSALGACADVGFMLNPGRFKLGSMGIGLFDYGMLTLGGMLQNRPIRGLTYDREYTRIPQLIKIGGAFGVGRHHGLSLLLAFDSDKYSDDKRRNSLGGELWWHQILGARFGYEINGDAPGGFSMGFGLRLDGSLFTDFLSLGLTTRCASISPMWIMVRY